MGNKIRVAELFAGVGGFRLGLEGWRGMSASSRYERALPSNYSVVWSNQWEPATKVQHASAVYENRFGKSGHTNRDIAAIPVSEIPEHDLLVGGFPCQDYSVASSLKNSKGLIGKKGVLWWSIHNILSNIENRPKYLLLENVDRLLISPSGQRGRDFAIILQSLAELGYTVAWQVINAADYGMPQRRKRVFIVAYLQGTAISERIKGMSPVDWILRNGTFAEAFPVRKEEVSGPSVFPLEGDMVSISENFNKNGEGVRFENSGILVNGRVTTLKTEPDYEGQYTLLRDIVQNGEVAPDFYIGQEDMEKWNYLKGPKKEVRRNTQGFEYRYSEGGMLFPDALDRPARTIITGEGGKSASRFKHVIDTPKGLRRLSPIELERLNMFPDGHTELTGVSDAKRAFFMGNALVVGIIERIGTVLMEHISSSKTL